MTALPPLIDAGAEFSPDEVYRYRLWRRWGPGPKLAVVGLNPSTADAAKNDSTVRRCIGFAVMWGFDGLEMLNLFAFRATDPREMLAARWPIGRSNRRILQEQCETAISQGSGILVAWGVHGTHRKRIGDPAEADNFRAMLDKHQIPAACFGLTQNGQPKHPLYQPGGADVVPFTGDGGRLVGATSEAPF